MKKAHYIKTFILIAFFLTPALNSVAQKIKYYEANKTRTNSSKEVLADLFQVALKNINSKDGKFELKSTLFALAAQRDSSILVDTIFETKRWQRNFEIDLGLESKKQLEFTRAFAGFTWAIVNNRDQRLINASKLQSPRLIADIFDSASKYYQDSIPGFASLSTNDQEVKNKAFVNSANEYLLSGKESDLLPEVKAAFLHVMNGFPTVKDKTLYEIVAGSQNDIKALEKYTNTRGLLTLAAKGSYDFDNNLFDNINLSSEYNIGVNGKKKKRLGEFSLKGEFIMSDDTTSEGIDVNRQSFSCSTGFNKVLMETREGVSVFEMKVECSWDYILSGLLTNEDANVLAANATFTVKVSDKISIPVKFKYDITNENFLGFLNVTWNLDGINK